MKRFSLLMLLAVILLSACSVKEDPGTITVYKPATCSCCGEWITYLKAEGLSVRAENTNRMAQIKDEHNVPQDMRSCHTAIVDGYVIEGHVPAADIERLLIERPDVIGLAVPGMPAGSPGMGGEGSFEVLVIPSGEVFSAYQ